MASHVYDRDGELRLGKPRFALRFRKRGTTAKIETGRNLRRVERRVANGHNREQGKADDGQPIEMATTRVQFSRE